MNDQDRREVVQLRIDNAHSALEEALLLINNTYWNAAVNRMYYACYYAVSALLISKSIETNTHAGARQMFGLHFVKTSIISSRMNAFYSDLFAKRHSGDYDVYIYFDNEITSELYPQAVEFVNTIETLLKQ